MNPPETGSFLRAAGEQPLGPPRVTSGLLTTASPAVSRPIPSPATTDVVDPLVTDTDVPLVKTVASPLKNVDERPTSVESSSAVVPAKLRGPPA